MTGYSVRGHMGFAPKEGETFDYRMNVRLHRSVGEELALLRRPDESVADVVRRAVREYVDRESAK